MKEITSKYKNAYSTKFPSAGGKFEDFDREILEKRSGVA